jgi:FkbM family methyltransferase
MLKLIIKRILKKIGWRLIKILPPPKSIQEDIQKEIIDAILHSNGVLHIGAHKGSEAPIYS